MTYVHRHKHTHTHSPTGKSRVQDQFTTKMVQESTLSLNNTTLLLCLAEVDGIKDIRVEKKNNLYSGDFKILKTFKVDPG